ncbi:LPD38 domain-containing protein [uncultured Megasphaera sp.]|uniref:LPD38 domain-containing protein n=2 Tax=uncultured Megasphaera sp. TaxID=165188 RepID=UPI0025F4FF1A|nr:LPD38 domain-containing protein [uncultured Megasphaera sp.]
MALNYLDKAAWDAGVYKDKGNDDDTQQDTSSEDSGYSASGILSAAKNFLEHPFQGMGTVIAPNYTPRPLDDSVYSDIPGTPVASGQFGELEDESVRDERMKDSADYMAANWPRLYGGVVAADEGLANVVGGIQNAVGGGNGILTNVQRAEEGMQNYRDQWNNEYGDSYFLNPNKFAADAGSVIGSSVPIMALSALMPGAAVAGGTRALTSALSRAGLGRLAMSEAGQALIADTVRSIPTSNLADSLSEYGTVVNDMMQNGMSEDEARRRAIPMFFKNMALDTFTVPLELGVMKGGKGIATGLLGRSAEEGVAKSIAKGAARTGMLAGASGLTEGYQEGAQNALENDVEGKRDGGWYNPLTWTNEDWEAARGGFVGGALMGVPGNVAAGFHPEAEQTPLSAESQEQAQSIKDTLSHGKPAGMSNAAYNAYIELANSGNPDLIKQAASSLESLQQSQEGSQESTDDAATEAYKDYEAYDQKQEIENFLNNNTVEQIGGEKNFNWLWGVLHNGTPEEVQHAYNTVIAAEKATAEQEAKNRPASGGGSMSPNTGNEKINAIIQAANDSGEDPRKILAMAAVETGGGDVNAIGATSSNLMQIEDATADAYGVDKKYPQWKTDPYQNAMAGIEVLKAKTAEKGDDEWAGVEHYNAGGDPDYIPKVQAAYDSIGDIGGGGSGNVEAPSEAFYDLSEAMNPQVDGMDPNTMAKMNLLARDFYQKYGHRLLVTSLKRNGDGSSYHDEGHAFDFSDDFLEQNPDARDWLVQQGEKYGLKGLDEFSHPVATTDGGNVHFTDHGGPAPGGASSGVSGKVTSDNGQFERELDQAAQEAKSDMDKIQAQSDQAMNEIMNDDSTEKTAQDAQQDAENAQKQADIGNNQTETTQTQGDNTTDVNQVLGALGITQDDLARAAAQNIIGKLDDNIDPNDPKSIDKAVRQAISAMTPDEVRGIVNQAKGQQKATSATPVPKAQQQTPHARLGRILSTYDRKDPKFKEYMNTFRNGTEQEQQKLADDLQTTQELERANSLKGNPLTTQQDQNIPKNVPQQAVEAPKQTEQVNTPVQEKESLETQKKRNAYLSKKQKLMERVPAGRTAKVHASTNDAGFDATYKIVPAGDITASHNTDYAVNDLYPAELQPRDRNRPQMRGQVEKMAKGMKPELLAESQFVNEGAPVVNNSGVVLNGNGRVMAVQKAYKGLADAHKKSAKAYKDYLVSIAPSLGIAPEKVQSVDHPVLVRQAADDADTSAIINSTEGGAKLGGAEQAKADADRLKLSTLEQFVDNGTGEFMNPSNREFRRAAASDVFSDAEGNSVFNEKGDLSPTGAFRIRNAIFAKAYNDNYLLTQLSEATDNNSKNIMNAMIAAAPEVAKVNEGIKNGALYPDYDISDVITKTAKTIMSLRNEGKPLSFHLQETDLFSQGGSEAERLVLEFIERNKFKSRTIADMYKGACDRIFAIGSPKQSKLFDSKEAPRISLKNIISNAIQEVEHGQSLFDTTEEKPAEKVVSEVPDNRQAEPAGSGRVHQQEAGRVQSQEKEGNEVDEKSKQSDHVDTEPQQTESKDTEGTHAEEGSQGDVQEEISKLHNVLDDEKSTPKQVIDAYKSVVDKVIASADGSRKNAKMGDKIVTDEYQSLTNSKHWNAFMNEDGGRNWHEVATINADAHRALHAIINTAGVKAKEAPSSQGILPYKQAVDDIMDRLDHKKLTPARAINKLKIIMKDANAARWGEFKAMEAIESKEKLSFDDYKMALDLANEAMKKANDMRLEASRKRKARKTAKELESATEETKPTEQPKEKAGFTDDEIKTLTDRGFNRWTKKLSNGKVMDRLYIKPEYLGLELTRYKSGNISSAKFNGETISNSEARRIEGTKCYVDVVTKEVVCDREDLKQAAQEVVDDALSKEKSQVLAQAETKKAAPKDDVVVTGNEFGEYKDLKELRVKAKAYYKEHLQGTSVHNPILGTIKLESDRVDFTRSGMGKMVATSAKEHKLLLVSHLKELIENADSVTTNGNIKNKRNASSYSYLHSTAIIDGKKQNVTITIFTDVNGNKYYNHTLPDEEGTNKKEALSVPPAQATKNSNGIPAIDRVSSTSIIPPKAEKGNKVDELRNKLSDGGKQAYDYAIDKLSKGNEKVAQSAKESAFIYARMAERWSEIMHEYGNKTYSPEDYIKSHPIVMNKQAGNAQLERAFEQRAWHGSGIDFDNFDLGKIGSGTGASMHGWGIYAAKSKRTAQKYKKEMKDRGLPSVLYEIDVPANKELLDEDKRYKDQMKGVQTKILKAVQSLSMEQKQAFWTKWLRQAMGSTKDEIQAETALRKVELNIKHCHDASLGWEGLPGFRKRIALDSLKKQGYTDEQINDTSYMESESKKWEKELPAAQQQVEDAKGAGNKKRNQLIEAAIKSPEATLEKGIGTGKEIYNYLTDALSDGKDIEKTSKYLNEQGIHGITYDDAYDGCCYVVFDDKAIQIIDKYNQDVHNAKAAYDASTGAIRLFDIADQSSFIHESAHMFLSDMERLAQKKDAPAGLVSDLQTVKDWAGYKPGQMNGYKGTALEKEFQEYAEAIREAKKAGDAVAIKSAEARWIHERFARGFERYIADGKAPNESLKNVFEKFKDWMVSIYQDLKNLGKKPPKEIQDVMARMITPKTDTKYSAREAHEQLARSKEDLKAEIKEAFPNAKEIKDEGDRMTFTMPNGSHIVVDVKNEILLTDEELAQAKKDHHIDDNGNVVVEGYAQLHGKDAYMALSQGSRENTGFHEAYHLAEGAVLTDREKAAIKKAIPDAEKRADKYAEWVEARKHGRGTAWGKLFQKIKDFAAKMRKIFTGVETVNDIFRQIESGKVWERDARDNNERRYAARQDGQEEAPVKPQDIIGAINDIVHIYEGSRLTDKERKELRESSKFDPDQKQAVRPQATDLYDRHAHAGFNRMGYFNMSNYGRILALHLDNVMQLKGNLELANKVLDRQDKNAAENKMNGVNERLTPAQARQNAVMDFGAMMIRNPELARETYPAYSKIFDEGLEQHPDLKEKLDKVIQLNETYQGQTAAERAAGSIAREKEKVQLRKHPKEWLHTHFDNFYTNWVDDKHIFAKVVARAEAELGRKLAYDYDVHKQAQMAINVASSRALLFLTGGKGVEETYKVLNKVYGHAITKNVTMKDIMDALNKVSKEDVSKTGAENAYDALGNYLIAMRTEELEKHYHDAYARSAGFDEEGTREIIQNTPESIKKIAQMYWDINTNIVNILQQQGLISKDLAGKLRKYKHYCPMYRDMSDGITDMDEMIGTIGVFNKGGGYANVSNGIKRIEGGGKRPILDPITSLSQMAASMISKCERNNVAKTFIKLGQDFAGLGDVVVRDPTLKHADPTAFAFTVWQNGEQVVYRTTPEIYDALTNNDAQTNRFTIKMASSIAQTLRTGATISPSFIVRNLLRDTMSATVNSKTGFYLPFVDNVRGAWKLHFDKEFSAEYHASGASMSTYMRADADSSRDLTKELLGHKYDSYPVVVKQVRQLISYAWHKYEKFGNLIEDSTRAGEFRRARNQGLSIDQAGQLAREITLDFSRHGKKGQIVNKYVPFFNATIQGTDKFIRTFKDNPMRAILNTVIWIILPSLGLWAINHDDDWYKELDENTKYTNWAIPLPGGTHLLIPKPQEVGILFGSGIEAVLNQMTGTDPHGMKEWARQYAEAMTPSLYPAVVRPLIEWMTNYSFWTGRNLVPASLQKAPSEMQFASYTSELAKSLGDTWLAKSIKLSPIAIDNWISGWFGSAGRFIANMLNDPISYVRGNSRPSEPAKYWYEMPVIGSFVRQNGQNSEYVNRMYEIQKDMNDDYERSDAGKQRKGKKSSSNKPKELKQVDTAVSSVSKLNKEIKAIRNDPKKDPDRKRQEIDQRRTKINDLAKKVVLKFDK